MSDTPHTPDPGPELDLLVEILKDGLPATRFSGLLLYSICNIENVIEDLIPAMEAVTADLVHRRRHDVWIGEGYIDTLNNLAACADRAIYMHKVFERVGTELFSEWDQMLHDFRQQ